jgi:hypothetical protein
VRRRVPAGEAASAVVNVNCGWVGRQGSRPQRLLHARAVDNSVSA